MPQSKLRAKLPRLSRSQSSYRHDSKGDRSGSGKQDSLIESTEPTRLMRGTQPLTIRLLYPAVDPCSPPDLQLNSLITPISENRVKVLTAVDKFEVARRLPKKYSKTFHVRRHIAHQQRRLNPSPEFISCGRAGADGKKRPWLVSYVKQANDGLCTTYGSTHLEHGLPGAAKHFAQTAWRSPKIPPFDPISRWGEATEGHFLKKFMQEQIAMEEGCQIDQVIGVTSPEMMRHVKETADLESTRDFGATGQTNLSSGFEQSQDMSRSQSVL